MGLFSRKKEATPVVPEAKTDQTIDKPYFNEIGNSGINESGGWIYEEFLPILQWPRAGAVYQEMSSNDPVVTAILLCSRQLIRGAEWTVEAASDSPEDLAAKEFLESCMEDMNVPWTSLIDDIISFFEYGFSYHEIVYKKRNGPQKNKASSRYNDNRIGWRKIASRSQRTLDKWEIDEYGSIRGMYQYLGAPGSAFIPIERSLLFRTTTARGNPEGQSFLRGAYRSWYFKKHIEEVEGIGIERDLAGLPVVTAPEGVNIFDKDNPQAVEARRNAIQLVTSIRQDRNQGVVLPPGWDLKLLSSGGSKQSDTNAVINRWDQRIAITMLSDIVMLGADKVGSFALASVKKSMLAASLDAQVKDIVAIFNDIAIPRLFAMNTFNITETPKLKVTSVDTPDLDQLGGFLKDINSAGMNIFPDLEVENYLRRMVNLPEVPDEEIERRNNAQEDPITIPEPPAEGGSGEEGEE